MTDLSSRPSKRLSALDPLQSKKLASDRWKILRQAILSSGKVKDNDKQLDLVAQNSITSSSVRSFSSFGLFTVTQHDGKFDSDQKVPVSPLTDADNWINYKVTIDRKLNRPITAEVLVKYVLEKPSLETLRGFNNTGNVCVWPAEEVMAYYCLKHLEMFQGTDICELGGGMTSLSGLLLATTHVPSKIVVTDGNQKSVENVKDIITANLSLAETGVSAEVLLWDQSFLSKPSTHDSTFDYVLCADCLFFTEVHSELVQVIFKLLKPNGRALMFAPKRSGTLEQFCSVASEYFDTQSVTKYDDVVWLRHKEALCNTGGHYKEDIHYPIMISLKKILVST